MKTDQKENTKKLGELIKDIKIAMFNTVAENGKIHSRPMATQEFNFDGELWFFSGKTTPKIEELKHHSQVQVSYSCPKKNKYVCVSGKAEVVRDRAKAEELWNPMYKAWFPKGLEDPDLILLKVNVEEAEYWDSPSSAVVHLIGFIKSTLTGKPMGGELSDHDKIQFAS